MNVPQIRLKVEGFRAISEADIIIDGITVVAGENGAGKSTLSKLLYYVFKYTCDYDQLAKDELKHKLREIVKFLELVLFDLAAYERRFNEIKINSLARTLQNELDQLRTESTLTLKEQLVRWESLVGSLSALPFDVVDSELKKEYAKTKELRLKHILSDILEQHAEGAEILPASFESITKLLRSFFDETQKTIESRPAALFAKALETAFSDGTIPNQFEVFEYGAPIVASAKNDIAIPYSIQNVIYTDTPMSIDISQSNYTVWDDLNKALRRKGNGDQVKWSKSIIAIHDIIKGDATLEDRIGNHSDFQYKREDGSIFNLMDIATGIRSFAILQLLLKNGSLNEKSLLIIDEPEVHLHPQWIVEYARLIVLLNKEVGVKFFIASHDPDFISAIRYISEKEGNLNKVNYYLAEKKADTYTYRYSHLGQEIDPIFKSFNKAIDKIEAYSA